jgi:hypothetical protein
LFHTYLLQAFCVANGAKVKKEIELFSNLCVSVYFYLKKFIFVFLNLKINCNFKMEIQLKIHATDFNQDIIDKIRQFLALNGESDLVINIKPKKKQFPKETRDEYFSRLDKAIAHLDNNKSIQFSTTEFQEFAAAKL